MLHTKFRGNRSAGPEMILKGFTIYGRGGHLGNVSNPDAANKLSPPPYPRRLHIKVGFDRPSSLGEEGV